MATGKLKQVEEDAIRITEKRFKDYLDELEYQKAKNESDVESDEKGKK